MTKMRGASGYADDLGFVIPSFTATELCVPTGNSRHIGHVREGRIEGDAFSRRKREAIPVDIDVQEERRLSERDTVTKRAKLLSGVKQGKEGDDKVVRQDGRATDLPGEGGSVRQGKVNRGTSKQRVLEGDASGENLAQAAKGRKKRVTK